MILTFFIISCFSAVLLLGALTFIVNYLAISFYNKVRRDCVTLAVLGVFALLTLVANLAWTVYLFRSL